MNRFNIGTPTKQPDTSKPTNAPIINFSGPQGGQYVGHSNEPLVTVPRGYGGVAPVKGSERDHIFPVSLGGTSNRFNIQVRKMSEAEARDNVEKYAAAQLKAKKISLGVARSMVLNWDTTDIPGQPAYAKGIGRSEFDNSGLGVAVNTITGIPKAAAKVAGGILNFGKEILQGIVRSAISAGLSIGTDVFGTGAPGSGHAATVDVPKSLQPVLGAKQVKNIQTRIAENEQKIKNSPFAQKFGLDQHALPLAAAGVILGTGMDVTPFGGEEGLVKKLATEENASNVVKLLLKTGLDEKIVNKIAPEIAITSDKSAIKDILKVANDSSKLGKLSGAIDTAASSEPHAILDHIPANIEDQAAKDWKTNYADQYTSLFDKSMELFQKAKAATGTDKSALQQQIQALNDEQVKLEEQFVGKWHSQIGVTPETPKLQTYAQPAEQLIKPSTAVEDITTKTEPGVTKPSSVGDILKTRYDNPSQLQLLENSPTAEQAAVKPLIEQATQTVKQKVHVLDYFATPEFVLEKIGLGKQANILRDSYDAFKKELPKQIDKITAWQKEVDGIPGAAKNIFKYLDGQKGVDLVPAEQKVADEMKAYLANWADRLGLPEDKRIASYITHIFEQGFINKEFDPELAHLITDRVPGSVYDPFLQERLGKMGYVEDVFAALDAYVKRAARKVNMDPALAELKDAAAKLDVESYNYVQRLASRINLRPTEIDNLIDNFIKSTGVGYKLGVRPIANLTNKVRAMIYRGTLGLNFGSALRNLTQGANTYAKLGEKYTVIGYNKLFSRLVTNNLDELFANGVLEDALITDRRIGVYKSILQKMDTGLFKLFDLAEKINRGAAYFGAKAKYIAEGKTEKEAVEGAKRIVRETQFAFGSIDSPVAMSSDLAKTVLQLQTYNVKQVEFIKNMIRNKEFGGLIRWTVSSLAMVYTIGQAFGMKPSDLIPTFRLGGSPLGNAFSTLTGLISPNQTKRDQAKAKLGQTISSLIPAGSQIRKTIGGIKAYNQGADLTASGKVRFKVEKTPGNLIRAGLFGKSSLPSAQEYYQNIGKKKTPAATPATDNRFNQ